MKTLNVGMLGTGFMGRTHSNAFNQVGHFFDLSYKPVLKCCCSRDLEKAKKFQATWGYENVETDWRKVVEDESIDIIDITTPNFMHKEMVIAAAQANKKAIICEKPLAMNSQEAAEMVEAVEKANIPTMVSFCYRRNPAVALFKQLVDENRIGRPFHYRARYDQDYTISTKVAISDIWRLRAEIAGSGVTGDLLAHSIDTAEWLNGPITRVCAKTEIFVKERLDKETGKMVPVTIDDACMFMAVFANGSIGTFESTRYARGRKNYNMMEMNGENGACFFNLEEPEYLQFFRYADPGSNKKVEDHLTGWQKILVTNSEHPYMNHYWVPGTVIGYEHYFINQLADFLLQMAGDKPVYPVPTIKDAWRTQKVCDAVIQSAKEERWIDVC